MNAMRSKRSSLSEVVSIDRESIFQSLVRLLKDAEKVVCTMLRDYRAVCTVQLKLRYKDPSLLAAKFRSRKRL